jgi:hypothetical protein
MSKPVLEFHTPSGPWQAVEGPVDGVWAKMLAEDSDTGDYTRLLRFDPSVDTSAQGVRTHSYWEEVYILEGDLTDLRLNQTFGAGMYACRAPGTPHGPWRTVRGALMLELRRSSSGQDIRRSASQTAAKPESRG